MCRACHCAFARIALATTTAITFISLVTGAAAQTPTWSVVPNAVYPTPAAGAPGPPESLSPNQHGQAVQRGPLARLVSNPDRTDGSPPFALADQNGTIQRYVEPVPGIDLAPYIGQVVVVRHDTGRTLLASQLELPPPPLYPMLGQDSERKASDPSHLLDLAPTDQRQQSIIQQAQYADNDDATVELLDEGEALPSGNEVVYPAPMPNGMTYPDGGYPVFPGEAMLPGSPGFVAPPCDPMQCDPTRMEWLPGGYGAAPCPQCGRYHQAPGYDVGMGMGGPFGGDRRAHVFADVEINFLRLHLMEEAVGKLSEKYEFSPRFIAGFMGLGPIDGRVRYWLYGRETQTLGGDDEAIRLEFEVLDLEGTHHFAGQRSEVVLAAGLRLANIELTDDDDADAGTDLLGLTLAADGRTQLGSFDAGRLAWVYGGRLSILGGDWGGDEEHDLIEERVRDDNVVVHELYAGLEFARHYRNLQLRARLAFELQNWHSDVLAENDAGSIGIVGPGVRVGAEF